MLPTSTAYKTRLGFLHSKYRGISEYLRDYFRGFKLSSSGSPLEGNQSTTFLLTLAALNCSLEVSTLLC